MAAVSFVRLEVIFLRIPIRCLPSSPPPCGEGQWGRSFDPPLLPVGRGLLMPLWLQFFWFFFGSSFTNWGTLSFSSSSVFCLYLASSVSNSRLLSQAHVFSLKLASSVSNSRLQSQTRIFSLRLFVSSVFSLRLGRFWFALYPLFDFRLVCLIPSRFLTAHSLAHSSPALAPNLSRCRRHRTAARSSSRRTTPCAVIRGTLRACR